MRNRLVTCLALLVLLLGVATLLAAQDNFVKYTVQDGDNLWKLAGENLDDASKWEELYKANPFLAEAGRRFVKDGVTYILIRPGERLAGLDKLGIVPTMTPLDQLELPRPLPRIINQVVTPTWLYWLIGLMFLSLIAFWFYTRNPIQWRPMVPGGLRNDAEADRRFEQYATAHRTTMVPGSRQKVRLFGIWNTQHRGIPVLVPHNYTGERAWRARFIMPNGMEETGVMTQECGNDVTIQGTRYVPGDRARIEEGWGNEAQVPAPVETPAPVPVPVPAEVVEEGTVKFEIRQPTGDQPAMVRMSGIDENSNATVEVKSGEISFRFIPKGEVQKPAVRIATAR